VIYMLQDLEERLTSIVEKVVPSVVSVSVTKMARVHLSRVAPIQGQGSGVILTDTGFIATNAHVVSDVHDVEVTIFDGRSFKAVVVGQSKVRDLAILKIDAEDLKPIEMGDSSKLKMGQFAIAVGNPLGLGTTVTFGMVSATDRTIQTKDSFLENLIQTSAQINPGNSGGALVDSEGNMIGMPTAMVPWSQGIGFAISVNGIRDVFDELVETGTIQTPWMGIVGVSLNKGIASHYNLPIVVGALIVQVPKGPSARAGMKQGDIIIAIDDEDVKSMEDLRKCILRRKVGEKMRVRFHRNNDIFETYVELMAIP
jgi:serine protease Do